MVFTTILSLNARKIESSNCFDSIVKVRTEPWTHNQIIALEHCLHVDNILDGQTIIGVLTSNHHKCEDLFNKDFNLYLVFVQIIKKILLPWDAIVIQLPTLDYFALCALLLAGANPQPHFSVQQQYLWPSLQWYMLSGENYFSCLNLLFDFGARADFIAYNGACTAMNLALWGFFWKEGKAIIQLLLKKGANPNMLCPPNIDPKFLKGYYRLILEKIPPYKEENIDSTFLVGKKTSSFPRKTYVGFFVGYTPLDCALISIIEQYYFYLVYDPDKGAFNRLELINTCQDVITLLSGYGGKASSKERLHKKLHKLLSVFAKFYMLLPTTELEHIVRSYIDIYGT